jgi:transposase
LDVHLEFCEVAVCDEGEVRSTGRVEAKPEMLELLAASLSPADRVALEVTGSAWEVVRIFEPHVAKVIVVSPGDTGISHARAKTDRLDARTLARLLWAGELDAVWTPDEPTRALRRRLSRREQLVRSRSRCKNEVHAVLMRRLVGRCPFSPTCERPQRRCRRLLSCSARARVAPLLWRRHARDDIRGVGSVATIACDGEMHAFGELLVATRRYQGDLLRRGCAGWARWGGLLQA